MTLQGFDLIKHLTELQGISGNEGQVRRFLQEELTPLVDKIEVSGIGNLYGTKYAKHHVSCWQLIWMKWALWSVRLPRMVS